MIEHSLYVRPALVRKGTLENLNRRLSPLSVDVRSGRSAFLLCLLPDRWPSKKTIRLLRVLRRCGTTTASPPWSEIAAGTSLIGRLWKRKPPIGYGDEKSYCLRRAEIISLFGLGARASPQPFRQGARPTACGANPARRFACRWMTRIPVTSLVLVRSPLVGCS